MMMRTNRLARCSMWRDALERLRTLWFSGFATRLTADLAGLKKEKGVTPSAAAERAGSRAATVAPWTEHPQGRRRLAYRGTSLARAAMSQGNPRRAPHLYCSVLTVANDEDERLASHPVLWPGPALTLSGWMQGRALRSGIRAGGRASNR